jgi:hypothetical protein
LRIACVLKVDVLVLLGRLKDALREDELIIVQYTLLRKLKVLGYLFIR